MQMVSGRMETNFVDSYKYNIAAFVLAEMLGLDNMVSVSIERKWQGDTGSMTFGCPSKWMMQSATDGKSGRQP